MLLCLQWWNRPVMSHLCPRWTNRTRHMLRCLRWWTRPIMSHFVHKGPTRLDMLHCLRRWWTRPVMQHFVHSSPTGPHWIQMDQTFCSVYSDDLDQLYHLFFSTAVQMDHSSTRPDTVYNDKLDQISRILFTVGRLYQSWKKKAGWGRLNIYYVVYIVSSNLNF